MEVSIPLDRVAQCFDSDYSVNCIDTSGSGSDDNNSTNVNGFTGDETSMTTSDNSLPLIDTSAILSKSRKERISKSQGKKRSNNSSCSNTSNTSSDSSDSCSRSASSSHLVDFQSPSQGELPINSTTSLQHEALPNSAAIAAYYNQLIQFSHNITGIGGIYPGLFLNQISNSAQSLANSQMYYNSMGGIHMPMNFYYVNSVNSTPTNNNYVNSTDNKNGVPNSDISQTGLNMGADISLEVFAIPWNDVIKLFEGEFDNIFGTSSCKAHLDVSEVLVDGAKGRWKHVLLLDTIVAFAFGLEKARPDSERRRFNQYSTLRECVVTIFHRLWVEFVTKQQTYLVEKLKETSDQSEVLKIYKIIQNLAILPKKIRVTGVSFPWHDCIILKNHLLAQSTAKSWKKREESVTFLIDKLQQYNGTLLELYSEVVNKLYYQHLCIPLGANGNVMNSSVNSSTSDSNGNNVTSADTDANQNNKALLELVAAVESVVADDMKINGKKRKISE